MVNAITLSPWGIQLLLPPPVDAQKTDRQADNRSAVAEIDWKSEMLAGVVWSKQTAEWGVGGTERDRGTETNRERQGDRERECCQSVTRKKKKKNAPKVTTPSMRWFSTEGNGAWGLSHKKQFIAKPTEVWEIQNLSMCQIFSETNCAVSGL